MNDWLIDWLIDRIWLIEWIERLDACGLTISICYCSIDETTFCNIIHVILWVHVKLRRSVKIFDFLSTWCVTLILQVHTKCLNKVCIACSFEPFLYLRDISFSIFVLDIMCSAKCTVFLELRSRKAVRFSEQIYVRGRAYFRTKWRLFVFTYNPSKIFASRSV